MATTVEKVYKLEVQGTDSINDLKSAIEHLTEKLKTLDEQSKEYLDTLEKITEYQEKLADAMSSISDSVESVSETVSNSIDEIGDTISSVGDALNNIGDVDTNIVDAFVEGFVDGLNEAQQSVDGLSEEFENLENTNLDNLKDSVSGVSESIDNISNVVDEAKTNLEDLNNSDLSNASQEINNIKENLENIGGATTVKELKQEISDLRDRLVTLDKDSDDYKATVKELIDAQVKLKEVMNAGKNEMEAAEGSYNALSQRMSALKQVWKEATDEATRNEIGRQIAEINNQLKGMDASIGNFQRNVGNYKSALDGLDGSFVNLKTQLRECKEAMQQLDPSSQAYADAMARAAEITHQLADQQEQIKYASPDLGDQLNNIRGIASNMAAGFGAVNAAMGLFGEKNEEVQQAMLKVQQAMALVQGLQGMDGFIKRTQGLSQSLGLVTKATQANTTATNANATATRADAAAKTAEGVATKSVVPAQLSLNAAMKANPIGFIIGLIAALVTAYSLLKDKIMEMIGANDNMSNAFNKVKAILSGFGNVIKNSVIGPIRMAITPIKTLAKMMIDLFSGDWSKIGDDFKEGMNEMKDAAIDAMNVVGNFKEGYDKKIEALNDEARKKEAAERQKELESTIKDNEAKYGSDWKYTNDAKKLYEELFKVRMEQYSIDSDEYREAQRDKLTYDREFTENQEKEEKKRTETAKKAAEKRLSDFKTAFEKYVPIWDKFEQDLYKNKKIFDDGLSDYLDDLYEFYRKAGKSYEETVETISRINSAISENYIKSLWNDSFGKEWNSELEKTFYQMDRTTREFVNRENNYFAQIKLTGGTLPDAEIKHFGEVYKETMDNINKEYDIVDKKIDEFYEKALESPIILGNLKVDNSNIQEWIDYLVENYGNYQQALLDGNKKIVDDYEKLMKDIVSDPWNRPFIEEALGEYLSEFQKMLDKREELNATSLKKQTEQFQKISDIRKEVYDTEDEKARARYETELALMELRYNKEEAFIEKRNEKFDTGNEIEAIKRQMEYENEYYTTTIEMYNNLRNRYYQMSKDMTLTAEERKNAEIEAAKITGQIIEEELSHETQLLKKQKDLIKSWKDAVTNSVSGVVDIMSTIGDAWSSMIDLEKNAIQSELEEGKISQEEADRREEQNKKSFESLKAFQIAQAIINTLAAAVSAYQSMASIPYVGPVLGGVAAAAALAAGYAQVRQIQATEYGGGSSVSKSSGGSTTFQLPDVMEYEPELGRNITNMSDTDELNNGGRGRGESETRVYVVESDISNALDKSNKRRTEVTF